MIDDEKANGSKKLVALEPELVFTSGKNRDGADALYEGELATGTLMNFILAVDKNCDLSGKDVPITDSKYDYLHPALLVETGSLTDMQEGKYAMLEKHPSKDGSGASRLRTSKASATRSTLMLKRTATAMLSGKSAAASTPTGATGGITATRPATTT